MDKFLNALYQWLKEQDAGNPGAPIAFAHADAAAALNKKYLRNSFRRQHVFRLTLMLAKQGLVIDEGITPERATIRVPLPPQTPATDPIA